MGIQLLSNVFLHAFRLKCTTTFGKAHEIDAHLQNAPYFCYLCLCYGFVKNCLTSVEGQVFRLDFL